MTERCIRCGKEMGLKDNTFYFCGDGHPDYLITTKLHDKRNESNEQAGGDRHPLGGSEETDQEGLGTGASGCVVEGEGE